jgi:hypothetical protein
MTTKTTKPITTKNPTNEKKTEKKTEKDADVKYKKLSEIIKDWEYKEQNIIRLNDKGMYIEGREKELVQLIVTNMSSADEFFRNLVFDAVHIYSKSIKNN